MTNALKTYGGCLLCLNKLLKINRFNYRIHLTFSSAHSELPTTQFQTVKTIFVNN